MDIKLYKIGLLITATQFLLSSGCSKNSTKPCVNGGYAFAVTSAWSPQSEIYNIGDTIFLNSEFPKTLTDLINPSITIDYSNSVGIGGAAAIYELDTVAHQPVGATSKFDFVSEIGIVGNDVTIPSQNKSLSYKELTTVYKIKIKIIPKQKGIFALYIPDLKSSGLSGKNCTNASFSNTLTNTSRGLSLFQYAMNRPPASQYEVDRIYCFRII